MERSVMIMVQRFNNWCNITGVKNSLVNYIWWKDNVINKKGK